MPDFVETTEGSLLLRLVSRGHALIAELLHLSNSIPAELLPDSASKFSPILHDFRYFKSSDYYEEQIESNPHLAALDVELIENYGPFLKRSFHLFDGIIKYYLDLLRYHKKLQDGVFIQASMETILNDGEGKQLMVEALALQALHLLLLNHRIPDPIRETLLVAHHRIQQSSVDTPNFDTLCALCRRLTLPPPPPTSSRPSIQSLVSFTRTRAPSPPPPPPEPHMVSIPAFSLEEYFARFPLPQSLVHAAFTRLRSDDVFNQLHHYPNAEHRGIALSLQAACLFLVLFHSPDVLHNDPGTMREVVEKYMAAGWVLPLYMGFTVDLTQAWDGFKAGKGAIDVAYDATVVRRIAQQHMQKVNQLLSQLQGFLSEGVLSDEFVSNNMTLLLLCLRECNITLRWLLLHRSTTNKKLHEVIYSTAELHGASEEAVLSLLLDTAQLEFAVKRAYEAALESKQNRWQQSQAAAIEGLSELAEYFAGSKVLAKKAKDTNLQKWFEQFASQARELSYDDVLQSGRRIQQMVSALEEVEQFHQIQWSLQIKQHLAETRSNFKTMINSLNMSESVLATLSVVSDASYGWGAIPAYTARIHARVVEDPLTVLQLRSTFLKLRSVLEAPLLRISQSGSPDLYPVSQYYSKQLLAYVRAVLDVIPVSLFSILTDVIATQARKLHEIPPRVARGDLWDYAQLNERHVLAEATHRAALLAKGIMAMETTFVGVIELDPRQLLEEGIRRQLVHRIASELNSTICFNSASSEELEQRLGEVQGVLQSLNHAIEYFQDFVHLQGMHVCLEELTRIVRFSTEQEANAYVKQPVPEWRSKYQSATAPIPIFPIASDDPSKAPTFMGRLLHKLLQLTDPRASMYLRPLSAWFDANGNEVVGLRTFRLLHSSVGEAGLLGLDRLLSFLAASELQRFFSLVRAQLEVGLSDILSKLHSQLAPLPSLPDNALPVYAEAVTGIGKHLSPMAESLARVGQAQLLRRQIASHLSSSAKIHASELASSAEAASKAALADLATADDLPKEATGGKPAANLVTELTASLEACGLHRPCLKVFVTCLPVPQLPLLLFVFTISQLPLYVLDPHLATLTCKSKKNHIDCCSLVLGVVSVLRQCHSSQTATYIGYLGQYLRAHACGMVEGKPLDARKTSPVVPSEVVNIVAWLPVLVHFAQIPREVVESCIPPFLYDRSNASSFQST